MIHGGRLRYNAHFLREKSSVELPFSSFGDHLINILRKVNRLIYAFKNNVCLEFHYCNYSLYITTVLYFIRLYQVHLDTVWE
jgi:hypothetical protein